jgi:transcriptional regulator with XRE-family HTH domain
MLDESLLMEATRIRERLIDLQREVELARVDHDHAIRRLHASGGSMREIAEALGLSHQRVHQIVEASGEAPSTRRAERLLQEVKTRARRWPFERFTRRAREVVVRAEREARALRHDTVGPEHLLLGILSLEEEPAARALEDLGVDLAAARHSVLRAVGGRGGGDVRRLAFAPEARRALEDSLREARALGHHYIGTQHVLLGLLRDAEGIATRVLEQFEVSAEDVRRALAEVVEA